MDELDAMAMTREEFIEKEVLCGREWMIEPNKFPSAICLQNVD